MASDWFLYQLIGFNHDVAIVNNFFSTIYILKQNYSKIGYYWPEQRIFMFL